MRRNPPIGLAILDDVPRPNVTVEPIALDLPGRSLKARLYRPRVTTEPLPLLVYFHFGGCVIGALATCHTACSIFAEEAGIAVLSVDYRLAPEHRYPAAVDDAVAAFRWAREHAATLGVDPDRIAVGGDSAGGYLAGAVCVHERDSGAALPALQLLIYPVTNWDKATRPATKFDALYPLSRSLMDWFCEQYLARPEQALEPLCSLARIETASGLPPTIVALAGHDLLVDDGRDYAKRLDDSGVPVDTRIFPTLPHGFSIMTGAIPAARAAMIEIARLVRARLG